ncbi:Ribosomal protein L10/L12 [Ostreococcus tauri]|uniref:Ribosomal protein L10/L12 n=1 Tax=Ostreococcus tauri TaxID=70448 RepID=A0A096PA80_OSTTA|nr:Ribosomal protein L10/L12 [Ostreococcus tauri]CEG01833.1 Ribosomal protein L10/L12 [Ostreococcus tauri]|eukprot:XP_022841194.1 Ribosomal protein L10/L12 [Ostreococcus tauri]
MKYVAAYLLAQLAGKESPSEADVKSILAGAAAEVDDSKLSAFFKEIEGKDVAALIEEGNKKLASVPAAGAAPAGGAAAAGGDAAGGAAAAAPEEEEEEAEMDFDLFD